MDKKELNNESKSTFGRWPFIVIFLIIVLNPFTLIILIPTPDPPEPLVKQSEFPFELVYEINGEMHIYSDTIVCEYDGVRDGGGSKIRGWNMYSKNTGKTNFDFLDVSEYSQYDYLGNQILKLQIAAGNAGYLMGDPDNSNFVSVFNRIFYTAENRWGKKTDGSLLLQEAYEMFGLKLLSWECAPPITNEFN